MVKIKQFLVVINTVVKIQQFLLVINTVVKIKQFLVINTVVTGGDNSNKHCFGTKPKFVWESGDFSRNRDTWKFFRETRDNSGTLHKKIGTSGNVSPKFGRMIQISGMT